MKKQDAKGRILKLIGGFYTVFNGEDYHVCRARGRFRARNQSPMVGDWVEYTMPTGESGGYITEVLDRKNFLKRPPVSNIDMLLITIAAKSPDPDYVLVDTLLVNANIMGIEPCIVVNKSDLSDLSTQNVLNQYPHIDKRFAMSALQGDGIDQLMAVCHGKTVCFAGQSGVGKTSILNHILPDINLEVGEVSHKTKRGKHTTRQASLVEFAEGYIVDSPGFSMLELEMMDPILIKDYYPDFQQYADNCRFAGCQHNREPGCAVHDAIEQGIIPAERHQRYLRLLNEMIERWNRRYD